IDYEVFCGVAPEREPSTGEAARAHGGVATVDAVTLLARLEAEGAPFLLDVREPWEWAVGSLGARGARLIPLAQVEARISEIPKDRPVVVYCKSGQRSARAARILAEHGFADVVNLEGGLAAWAREVEPTVSVA